ncbi:MAG: hypothetical protein LWX56_04165 [Ignavibacteria bacterium]|nr:hypothetical protein [Ignavibacteria bacterium]
MLTQFPFSEGRVVPTGLQFVYEYQMKDYLGNVRCSFRVNNTVAEVTQEDMYYPFGLSYRLRDGGQSNRYLYNGQEPESFNKLYWNNGVYPLRSRRRPI